MAEEVPNRRNVILGVDLIVDRTNSDYGTSLGVVLIAEPEYSRLTVASLRSRLKEQLPSCPSAFIFCSKESWPISHLQEADILVTQIITENKTIKLQKKYEKPKVGIKEADGTAIGFIFCDYSSIIRNTRDIVYRQVLAFKDNSKSFQFLDSNGWPISFEQENHMTVMDILIGSCISVNTDSSVIPLQVTTEFSPPEKPPFKRHKVSHDISFRSGKDMFRQLTEDKPDGRETVAKQILISYVRAEAAQHAVSLKEELAALGYSIYLDVDEIQSGVDWQDSLNFAVSGCEVFVPLVTRRYGETQWTNREVKLADVLGKYILPVNFLSEWPPGCLAIQFATTQFIPWKPPDEQINTDGEAAVHIWDRRYIQRVAQGIGERIRRLSISRDRLNTVPSLVKRKTVVQSCACLTESTSQAVTSDREGRPFVVICVHPQQTSFGKELQHYLEGSEYEVWMSSNTDMDTVDGVTFSQDILVEEEVIDSQEGKVLSFVQQFQERADEACVVIVVLSQAFSRSRTCQQQMFYCEHRKRVIPVLFEEFVMPGWMSMLIGNKECQVVGRSSYKNTLLSRLKRALDPDARDSPGDEINEAKIGCAVERLKQKVNSNCCVYIVGGTEPTDLCRSIGLCLAGIDNIVILTGGWPGVEEATARAFHDETKRLSIHAPVWHILHEADVRDKSNGTQNGLPDFGKTLYYGDNSREKETIVSRAFKICLLIEGGGRSVQEAEKFLWNDHIVIPVRCQKPEGPTGIQDKMLEIPQGVDPDDWTMLSDLKADNNQVAQAVARIVGELLTRQHVTSPAFPVSPTPAPLQTSLKSILVNKRSPTQRQRTVLKSPPRAGMSPPAMKPNLSSMKTLILK